MEKIKMQNAIAELDGDEMTHVLWGMIKDELILPFVELNREYYDLSIQNRDKTEDAVTVEAAEAIKRLMSASSAQPSRQICSGRRNITSKSSGNRRTRPSAPCSTAQFSARRF